MFATASAAARDFGFAYGVPFDGLCRLVHLASVLTRQAIKAVGTDYLPLEHAKGRLARAAAAYGFTSVFLSGLRPVLVRANGEQVILPDAVDLVDVAPIVALASAA